MKFISKIAIALFLTFSLFSCSENELTENNTLTKEQA